MKTLLSATIAATGLLMSSASGDVLYDNTQQLTKPYLGDDMEWSLMLHGEQMIKLYRPIPPAGKLIQVGECTDIFDKGKGAVYRAKITGKTEDGEHLYDAQWSIFYLGAGGFGEINVLPDGEGLRIEGFGEFRSVAAGMDFNLGKVRAKFFFQRGGHFAIQLFAFGAGWRF